MLIRGTLFALIYFHRMSSLNIAKSWYKIEGDGDGNTSPDYL